METGAWGHMDSGCSLYREAEPRKRAPVRWSAAMISRRDPEGLGYGQNALTRCQRLYL